MGDDDFDASKTRSLSIAVRVTRYVRANGRKGERCAAACSNNNSDRGSEFIGILAVVAFLLFRATNFRVYSVFKNRL